MSGPTCERCGAEIVFVTTAKGKQAPCNVPTVLIVPDKAGTISGLDAAGVVIRGREPATVDEVPDGTFIRISHFATCPAAAAFRKPKTRK